MLYILTRDGKAYHDFIENHNMTTDEAVCVKSINQIKNIENAKYVLLLPYPTGFNRELQSKVRNWTNLTSYYNKISYCNR